MALLQQGAIRLARGESKPAIPLLIDAKTASLTLRIPTPTTAGPLAWSSGGQLQVSLVAETDGAQQRVDFTVSGGVQQRSRGRGERSEFVATWALPMGWFDASTKPRSEWPNLRQRRLGETATSSYRAWMEIESKAGNITTSYELSSFVEEAPQSERFHSSIAFLSATAAAEDGGDFTISVSYDAGAGTDRAALVVAGSDRESGQITHTVTYGGAAVSIARSWDVSDAAFSRCTGDIWIDSEIGSGAKTVQLVASGGSGGAGGSTIAVTTMTGVHQTVPAGTAVTDASQAGTGISCTVGSVLSTDLVVDGLYIWNGPGTIGANQTERATATAGSNVTKMSTQAGADGGVMTWGDGSGEMTYGAVAFKESAGGAATVKPPRPVNINQAVHRAVTR